MKFHERHELFSKYESVVKTPDRLQENWPHLRYHMTNLLYSWNCFFFLCSYIILHKLIGLERSWRHCCIYWKIQRIRCTITLFWKAQAWLKKILCFLCKNYTCSKNQNKQNNQTQEQQNSSTPELFFITHLPSWRTNIYMTMPFPNYKQINHIHLFLKARVKDQLILLTYLTST